MTSQGCENILKTVTGFLIILFIIIVLGAIIYGLLLVGDLAEGGQAAATFQDMATQAMGTVTAEAIMK